MKSNAVAGFLFMILVVVYPLVNGIQTDSLTDMARFIPASALLYFEQRDGAKIVKGFIRSPLGKKIASINFIQTAEKIGLPEPAFTALTTLQSFTAKIKDNRLLHEVLGKKIAFALLPAVDQQHQDNFTGFIKNNVVLIARPSHSAETLQFFTESYVRYIQTYSVSTAQYGKHHIKRLQLGADILSIVIIDGMFVMSLNETQLRRCIDTYDGELAALSKKADYIKIRQKFTRPDRFFYLPVDEMRRYVIRETAERTFVGKELLQKELTTTVGFANFAYGSWNKKKKTIDKVLVQYQKEQVNSVVKNYIDVIPIHSSMLSLATDNPMAFYWSNTIEFKHLFKYVEQSRKEDMQFDKFWSTVQEITGKSTSEIVALLGDEASLILEPGPRDTFFSFPLGMFFVEVYNVAELQTVLQKVIDALHIPVTEASYGPVHYVYWTASPQDGLQPLYGFWHNLLFFGNSSSLLQMIVQRKTDNMTLLDNAAVRAIDPGLSEKNNSMTYMNNVEIINVLQKGLNLVAMTLAIEDRETASKVRTVIDEIINPLLDGARMYGKSCTRSYFTPEMVIIDSITTKNTGVGRAKSN